jgi:hypothetical protein
MKTMHTENLVQPFEEVEVGNVHYEFTMIVLFRIA